MVPLACGDVLHAIVLAILINGKLKTITPNKYSAKASAEYPLVIRDMKSRGIVDNHECKH